MKFNYAIIIIIFSSFFVSCSSNNVQEQQEQTEPPSVLEYETSIYNNRVVLDASTFNVAQQEGAVFKWQLTNAPNEFECYSRDCDPDGNNQSQQDYFVENHLTYYTDSPELTFLARQVGEYIINLKILDQDELELFSNDFKITVVNEIPDFIFDNLFTETFQSNNSWVEDSYSMQQYAIDYPNLGYVYGGATSVGGEVTVIDNGLTIDSGSFIYRNASKDFNGLNISPSDNVKVSIRVEGDSFTSRIDYFDNSDNVSNFIIQFNNYKISFKNHNDYAFCTASMREYFLNRYDLSNRDIDFYIFYNTSGTPEFKVIAQDINITERFKIQPSLSSESIVTFQVYPDVSNYTGGGILFPQSRVLKLKKLDISKININ